MPKQIDVEVSKPQNKHGHRRTRKCPIENLQSMFYFYYLIYKDRTTIIVIMNITN